MSRPWFHGLLFHIQKKFKEKLTYLLLKSRTRISPKIESLVYKIFPKSSQNIQQNIHVMPLTSPRVYTCFGNLGWLMGRYDGISKKFLTLSYALFVSMGPPVYPTVTIRHVYGTVRVPHCNYTTGVFDINDHVHYHQPSQVAETRWELDLHR